MGAAWTMLLLLCVWMSFEGGFGEGSLSPPLPLPPPPAAPGNATSCQLLRDTMQDGTLVLNSAALKVVNGSVQEMLDCVPPASTLLVDVEEIPVQESLIIQQSIVIKPKKGSSKLACPPDGIKINASDVTLQGLKIEECTRKALTALIDIQFAQSILLQDIEFIKNTNTGAPSCISGANSTLTLQNVNGLGNRGYRGGFMRMSYSKITIENSKFQENYASSSMDGGAIYLVDCHLDIKNIIFKGNNGVRGGGLYFLAFRQEALQINVDRCAFIGNRGYSGGGAHFLVYNAKYPSINFSECTFNDNAASYGGGVYAHVKGADNPYIRFTRCVLQNNTAYSGGGVMSMVNGTSNLRVLVEDCSATKNSVKSEGGGFRFSVYSSTNSSIQFNNCKLADNIANTGGGAMSLIQGGNNSRIVYNDCTARRNSAGDHGGGILSWVRISTTAQIQFKDCAVTENSAGKYGGGLLSWVDGSNSTQLQISGCDLEDNDSAGGGGLYTWVRGGNKCSVDVSGCNFRKNTAAGNGGGLLSSVLQSTNSLVQFTACTLEENNATVGGGIMSRVDSDENSIIHFNSCNAKKNFAKSEGGGLKSQVNRSKKSRIQLNECAFEDNKSARGGGVMSMVGASTDSHVDFTGCSGINNKAEIDGGGILSWLYDSNSSFVNFESCTAIQNSAETSGGGLLSWVDRGENCHVQLKGCTIEENKALVGAGVMSWGTGSYNDSIKFDECVVSKNSATRDGGGLYFGVARTNDTESKLEKCLDEAESASKASDQSSQFQILESATLINTIFTANRADSNGGAIFTQNVESGSITSCTFEGNSAKKGGALYIYGAISEHEKRKVWSMSEVNFTGNSANETGGGVSGFNGFDLKVMGSTFSSNSAAQEGGALAAKSSSDFPNVTLEIHNSILINNVAQPGSERRQHNLLRVPNSGGGALFISGEGSRFTCTSSSFSANTAGTGGAIFGGDSAKLSIRDSDMSGNVATLGGAAAFKNVDQARLVNNTFKSNAGNQGGAVYVVGSGFFYSYEIEKTKQAVRTPGHQFDIEILDSDFVGNDAFQGGGALIVTGASLLCIDTFFESNFVYKVSKELSGEGGGLLLQQAAVALLKNSEIKSCEAHSGGGMFIEDAIVISHNLKFNSNYASDVGSAIAAVYKVDFRTNDPVIAEFYNCSFTGNEVGRAGIINVVMEEYDEEHVHRRLLLSHPDFASNAVKGSESLILVSDLHDIEICCALSTECFTSEGLHELEMSCIAKGFQQLQPLGTFMYKLDVSPDIIKSQSSGHALPDIKVTMTDAFGSVSPTIATLSVSLITESGYSDLAIPPAVGEQFTGTTNVTGIKLTAHPGEYRLLIKVQTLEGTLQVAKKEVQVRVRKCKVGEISMKKEMECFKCPANFYSFDPSQEWCKSCPSEKAHCNGTTLTPLNGFWQWSSHSDSILPCLNEKACSYDGRLDRLTNRAQEEIDLGVVWDNEYPLCSEGYEGILCGSCSSNEKGTRYGKNPSLDCERCIKNTWKAIYVLLCIAVLVGLTVLFEKGAKSYAENTLSGSALLRSSAFSPSNQSASSLPTERHCGNHVHVKQSSLEGNAMDPEDILKILVNFLQVSTTVTSFKLDWQGAVLTVLNILGMATGSAYFAFSCAFEGPDRFIYANYAAIALPFVVWSGFAVVGLIRLSMGKSSLVQAKTSIFVSAMAILDISYIGLTQKMVQVFYCVRVDLGSGHRWYWAEDTSIQCYEGSHLYIMMFAGFPLVLFVCLGFPMVLFVKLYWKKRPLHSNLMLSRYGYFYQGYFADFAYWEVLIQVRKGLLAILSVLSAKMSEELKVYIALVVLLVAFAFHTWFYPYKQRKLNRMEASSLFLSSLVCLLEGVIHSPEGGNMYAKVLSGIILVILVGFVAYMMYEYFKVHIRSLQRWLEVQDEYIEYTGGCISWVSVLVKVLLSHSKSKIEDVGDALLNLASTSSYHRRSPTGTYSRIRGEETDSSEEQDASPFEEQDIAHSEEQDPGPSKEIDVTPPMEHNSDGSALDQTC